MCCAGNNVGVRHGVGVQSCRNKPCDVRHIHHQICADFVGNLAEACKVDHARIGTCACNDNLGFVLQCNAFHFVVVYRFRDGVDAICNHVEILAADVDGTAMGKMSAVGQVHAHDCVARIE